MKRCSILAGIGLFATSAITVSLIQLNPAVLAQNKVALKGAGATFPAPAYTTWFSNINKKYPNLQLSYQAVGSGAGVQQFIAGTVDFGASDTAMTPDEIAKVSKGVVLIPITAGLVAIGYNAPGFEAKLTRQQLVDIFLGKAKNWKQVGGPNQAITVVHRSDSSGTTAIFTSHLAAISPEWKSKVGSGKTIKWPVGVGAKGNPGVAALIKQTPGAVGYLDYVDAQKNKIQMASLQNKAGKLVAPKPETAAEGLTQIKLDNNLVGFNPDPDSKNAYPIVTLSWIMAYGNYDSTFKTNAIKTMLKYCLSPEAQNIAGGLGYVPLPSSIFAKARQAVDKIK